MPDIRHRVAISAPLEACTRQWPRRKGSPNGGPETASEGSRARGPDSSSSSVSRNRPPSWRSLGWIPTGMCSWNCVEGADEWVGTKLAFDLTATDDETVVLFTHADWREPSEFMAHCSARWAYFLLSLKSYLETGKGTPFPEDLKF